MSLSLAEFVTRWKASTLTERAAARSHFLDLCNVLGQQHPAAADPTGDAFTFEKHVSATRGGKGFADVWKRGFFAWEYKGKIRTSSSLPPARRLPRRPGKSTFAGGLRSKPL